MPATKLERIDINLIGADDFSHTPIGRVVLWATTYGRYIMILTEIVVLLAFVSRFSLDRRLTDLKEEIAQKQAIIESNIVLEESVRTVQHKLQTIKTLLAMQTGPVTTINDIQKALPPDVFLDTLELANSAVQMKVRAATTQGIAAFLSNLQSNPRITNIELGDIKSRELSEVQFDVTLTIGETKKLVK